VSRAAEIDVGQCKLATGKVQPGLKTGDARWRFRALGRYAPLLADPTATLTVVLGKRVSGGQVQQCARAASVSLLDKSV